MLERIETLRYDYCRATGTLPKYLFIGENDAVELREALGLVGFPEVVSFDGCKLYGMRIVCCIKKNYLCVGDVLQEGIKEFDINSYRGKTSEACKTCRFRVAEACHRQGPSSIYAPNWPLVNTNDWCGEWELREDETEKHDSH